MKKKCNTVSKPVLYLGAAQFLIMLTAILFWLFHRGNAYQYTFDTDDYSYLTDVSVEDGVSIDPVSGYQGVFMRTSPLTLEKGIYDIYINYSAGAGGSVVSAGSEKLGEMEMRCAPIELNPACQSTVMTLDISRKADDITINVSYSGTGILNMKSITIAETGGRYKKDVFYAFLLCLFLCLLFHFKRSDRETREILLGLIGIYVVSCYPLYTDYLRVGHDIPFHLLRIEGIAKGLSHGVFPVKIHPNWAKDYGYAVGVLYGDAMLYIPAILRLIGFSVQTAYKFYVAAIHLGTVVISYFSFKRIFQSKKIGLFGCLIYTLSYYRLIDTYTRAAVGEYTSMMFLPFILLGFFLIFTEAGKENWWKYSILTAFGLSGLIQTHLLSCEMAGLAILLVCLLMIRKVFQKYTFLSLAGGAALTLLMNIGFLIPCLEYYGSGLCLTSDDWVGNTVGMPQGNGIFPVQLFTVFQNSNGTSLPTPDGVSEEFTMGMGIFFLLALAVFLYVTACHYRICKDQPLFQTACICTGLGCVFLYMSTCYFPWDTIVSWGETASDIVRPLQYPWRMLEIATALLCVSACFAFSVLFRVMEKNTAYVVFAVALVLSAVNIGWYFYDFCFGGEPYRVYETYEINSMQMYSYEYLPDGTKPELIVDNALLQKGIDRMEGYEKQGTTIRCSVAAGNREGYIDFPLNYYKHYSCKRPDTGENLFVSAGYNNMVRVTFPADFDGDVVVSFEEPWYWRLSECISFLCMAICALTAAYSGLSGRYGLHFLHRKRKDNGL